MFAATRSRILLIIAVPGVCATGAAAGETGRQASGRLNVLFIVADDLNTRLHCYGWDDVQTPNLDRLAAGAMRFDRAYCQYPLCNPSRCSFLTGLRPDTTGILDGQFNLRDKLPGAVTLPQAFRGQRYWTAVVNKFFHEPENDGERSWDERRRFYDKRNPMIEAALKKFEAQHGRLGPSNRALWEQQLVAIRAAGAAQTPPGYGPTDMSDEEQGDGQSARQVVTWLQQRAKAEKPFFIGWGLVRPHIPHWAPKKYFGLYPLEGLHIVSQPADDLADVPPQAINPRYALYGQPRATDAKRREVTAAYYACVSFIDAQIGLVLQALDRLGLAESTIVVVVGDHGYLLGEHGLWEKSMLFEPAARMPLLIRVPNVTVPGAVCSQIVEFVDLFPTLAELCQVKVPGNLEGLSFVPLLHHPNQAGKQAAFTVQKSGKVLGRSVRTQRWRYTQWGSQAAAELYDEQNDPDEFINLAAKPAYASQVQEMRRLLQAGWRSAWPPATLPYQ